MPLLTPTQIRPLSSLSLALPSNYKACSDGDSYYLRTKCTFTLARWTPGVRRPLEGLLYLDSLMAICTILDSLPIVDCDLEMRLVIVS